MRLNILVTDTKLYIIMPEEHNQPPKTVAEIGIHIGYMRDDLKEIKDTIKNSPTRQEFDALKTDVGGKVSRREVGVMATVLTLVLGFLSFIFNNLPK